MIKKLTNYLPSLSASIKNAVVNLLPKAAKGIKRLTKCLIIIGCIAVVEVTIYYCICEIDRRIQEKERIAKNDRQ